MIDTNIFEILKSNLTLENDLGIWSDIRMFLEDKEEKIAASEFSFNETDRCFDVLIRLKDKDPSER